MQTEKWQLKVRLPGALKDEMHHLANQQERSINFLFVKAITEYLANAQKSEPQAGRTARGSDCPTPR